MALKKPQRPTPIVSADGNWQIIPTTEVFKVRALQPRSLEEEDKAKKEGQLVRIVYSFSMYDLAMQRAEEYETQGKRIEFIYAEKDVLESILNGDFEVLPLEDKG